MGRQSKKEALIITEKEKENLTKLSQSATAPFREVRRAKILLQYHEGVPISDIASGLGTTRPTAYKCIDKALAMGVEAGLKDTWHSPKEPVITEEAKSWVISLACKKPKDFGQAAEFWTRRSLAEYVRKHSDGKGHACLHRAGKATVHRILVEHPIRPDKIAYYCNSRDPEFGQKMRDVLMVYKEVALDLQCPLSEIPTVSVSVDEKPGIQALDTLADDIMPDPNGNSRILRDHQYKRLGTVSLLAALDLQDGHVIAQVHDRHRSREFICLLEELDRHYSQNCRIRIVLDNHSAHTSKETRAWLATKPNRFVYVHTPTHGSWLNLIETLFGKMSRTFLKGIRVQSLQEIKDRIMLGIAEINAAPVVHRWKKFDTV